MRKSKYIIINTLLLFNLFAIAECNPSEIDSSIETDAVLPRTDPIVAGKIYQMLKILDQILTAHHIPYWIDGGVLLGAVRHQGLIPWDDDGDIEVHESDWHKILALEPEFNEYGYEFRGVSRLWVQGQDFPFIDILLTAVENDKVVLQPWAKEVWPNNWFYLWEIYPGQLLKFGPLLLHAPTNPERYLKAHYGEDCLEYAECWQHANGGFQYPRKVKVTDFDPAPYVIVDPRVPLCDQ